MLTMEIQVDWFQLWQKAQSLSSQILFEISEEYSEGKIHKICSRNAP